MRARFVVEVQGFPAEVKANWVEVAAELRVERSGIDVRVRTKEVVVG